MKLIGVDFIEWVIVPYVLVEEVSTVPSNISNTQKKLLRKIHFVHNCSSSVCHCMEVHNLILTLDSI